MIETIRVAKRFFLPEREIKFYCAYDSSNFIKRDVRNRKNAGQVIDMTSGKRTNTVIYLQSGEVILTNLKVESIDDRIKENSLQKMSNSVPEPRVDRKGGKRR